MEKCWVIAFVAIFNLVFISEVTSRHLNADQLKNLSTIANIESPVRYDGAQLWSVNFDDIESKQVVISLKQNFG